MAIQLPLPHGGSLVNCMLTSTQQREFADLIPQIPSLELTPRQSCDLELILNGGFSPLQGFVTEQDYFSILENNRLSSGVLWPIPITLAVNDNFAKKLDSHDYLALRKGPRLLAIMTLEAIWTPNKTFEAQSVFGTTDLSHPGVRTLFNETGNTYLGGRVFGFDYPNHPSQELHFSPAQLRQFFKERGWDQVVAFQTRNPLHRAHVELIIRAREKLGTGILLHPVVGPTKQGDIAPEIRINCYQAVLPRFPKAAVKLSLLPLAMRMAGPKEALWHGIIRKNYGCSHFIVGRDHAGPGVDGNGKPFYSPYAAQEFVASVEKELGITMAAFSEMVYVEELAAYQEIEQVAKEHTILKISGTQLREMQRNGEPIPSWFSYPEVIEQLWENRVCSIR